MFLGTQRWKNQLSPSNSSISQWRHRNEPHIMLNADTFLAFPISTELPPLSGPKPICGPSSTALNVSYGCKNPTALIPPTTYELCRMYATNNSAFLQAFAVAYTKMTTVGYGVPAAEDGATSTGKLGTLTSIDLDTCS